MNICNDKYRYYIEMAVIMKNGIKHYTPNVHLVDYFKNILQQNKSKRRQESARKSQEDNKNLPRMKVHYLDKHIFQAMADLMFFFQTIAEHKELQEVYEDDIKDLLGIRRAKPNELQYGFVFVELISVILSLRTREYEYLNEDEIDTSKIKKDYPLKLTYKLQEIIFDKLQQYLNDVFNNLEAQKAVAADLSRVLGWVGMLASNVSDEHNKTWIERDESRLIFHHDISSEVNPPARTFDFDTTRLQGDEK
jgi:hypothetical protein